MAAGGCAAPEKARPFHLRSTRFRTQGLLGRYDEPRPGRPRSIEEERIMDLLQRMLHSKPPAEQDRWSVRTAAAQTELSKSTMQRIRSALTVQPHTQKHFKLSTDPFFVEKVGDITGVYVNPPEHALVLASTKKSQIQALERTQLPAAAASRLRRRRLRTIHIRHGTVTLIAALDVASGHILTQCQARHRHQEFLRFLKQIEGPPGNALR